MAHSLVLKALQHLPRRVKHSADAALNIQNSGGAAWQVSTSDFVLQTTVLYLFIAARKLSKSHKWDEKLVDTRRFFSHIEIRLYT